MHLDSELKNPMRLRALIRTEVWSVEGWRAKVSRRPPTAVQQRRGSAMPSCWHRAGSGRLGAPGVAQKKTWVIRCVDWRWAGCWQDRPTKVTGAAAALQK